MQYEKFMTDLAKKAGKIMKKYYGNANVQIKKDSSPLTIADTEINDLVISEVQKNFPDHDIYGEEASSRENDSAYVWVCDPIDGTFCYANEIPCFCFSLALVYKGKPIAAIVFDVMGERMCYSEIGKGAYCNGKPIRVDQNKSLLESHVSSVFSSRRSIRNLSAVYSLWRKEGAMASDFYSCVYMGMLVAMGKLSAFVFPYGTAHDAAAIKLLIEEAGGKCTDLDGNDQEYSEKINGFVGTNGLIHKKFVSTLRE